MKYGEAELPESKKLMGVLCKMIRNNGLHSLYVVKELPYVMAMLRAELWKKKSLWKLQFQSLHFTIILRMQNR
jgi:hypothetical protein